jgi:hypothetical protein
MLLHKSEIDFATLVFLSTPWQDQRDLEWLSLSNCKPWVGRNSPDEKLAIAESGLLSVWSVIDTSLTSDPLLPEAVTGGNQTTSGLRTGRKAIANQEEYRSTLVVARRV